MPPLKLPVWLWHFLIVSNVFNFTVGFIIADRQLMLLALVSGICCWFGYKVSMEETEDE